MSKNNVIALAGVDVEQVTALSRQKAQPNAEVIQSLRDLLALAETGELRSLCVCGVAGSKMVKHKAGEYQVDYMILNVICDAMKRDLVELSGL